MTKRINLLQLQNVISVLSDIELNELNLDKAFNIKMQIISLQDLLTKLAIERTDRILKTNPDFVSGIIFQ